MTVFYMNILFQNLIKIFSLIIVEFILTLTRSLSLNFKQKGDLRSL